MNFPAPIQSEPNTGLLYSDDQLFRYGLQAFLRDKSPRLQLSIATSEEKLLSQIAAAAPQILIADLIVSQQFVFGLIERLRQTQSDLKILVVADQAEIACAERCMMAGANGYLNPRTDLNNLAEAIHQLLAGEIYLSQKMQNRLLTGRPRDGNGIHKLTARELDVFYALGQGTSTREIAVTLGLSVKTIETYREKLKQKLQIRSSQQLVRYALEASVFRFESKHQDRTTTKPRLRGKEQK